MKCMAAFLGSLLVCSIANAQLVTFDFTMESGTELQSFSTTQDGLTFTADNPTGNTMFPPDAVGFFDDTLFIDGGNSPNQDWTFSQSVQLVGFTLGNNETGGGTFDLFQGGVSSLSNNVGVEGSFDFTNTTGIFQGGQAISLVSSDHDGEGYGFSTITVRVVPEPSSAVLVGLTMLAICGRRKRAS